jgi:uncharacterized protein (DUF2147 family)
MKINSLLFTPVFFIALNSAAQKIKPDDIVGTWVAGENKAKVQIYKVGNKYHGRITWLRDPVKNGRPKTDVKNPDPKLRNTPIVGLVVLRNFIYDDREWLSGEIYDPSNGKEYSCKITMPDPNTLKVRGYLGISLFGRTEVWKRGS